jgi:ornithine cyclodeaminase
MADSMTLISFISNEVTDRVADEQLAYDAVREALVEAAGQKAILNPVVIGQGSGAGETFSLKSGTAPSSELAGVKIGSFWPGNPAQGLSRHGTFICLIDPKTGRVEGLVQGDNLNGLRTAASNAVATTLLARADASTLAIVGAGHQAAFEARALCRVRPIARILIASRTIESAEKLAQTLGSLGPAIEVASAEDACAQADIVVTATPSRAALFEAGWIRPGTHISAMGTDQRGKQELPVELYADSQLFADYPIQSRAIGEFQHAPDEQAITAIGDVVAGRAAGRGGPDAITIYDSSGIALQDLFVAQAVVERARALGLAVALGADSVPHH